MLHIKTPYVHSKFLSEKIGNQVFLKMDVLQPVRSFKIRGIGLACERARERGCKELLSSSGGNAGLAVAFAGSKLKLPVRVVVPKSTPEYMLAKISHHGATVSVHGDSWDDANEFVLGLLKDKGDSAAYIPPFDHPDIWEGHQTLIQELPEQPEAMVVAVGGGGLIKGVLDGLIERGWGDTTVFSAETNGAESMAQSLEAQKLIQLPRITSKAHSLGAKKVSEIAFRSCLDFGVQSIVVSDDEAQNACVEFERVHKERVELACGAALAPVFLDDGRLKKFDRVCVVVCGGAAVGE